MATRDIVPRAHEEGNIGTAIKNWLKGWFKDIFVSNILTDGSNTATVANIKDAVDKKHSNTLDHIQDTDQKLDEGGGNEVGVADVKDAVSKKHTQNADTALGAQSEDLDMNTHKISGVVDPVSDQDAATKKHVADNSINNVSEDATPELGGELDAGAHSIGFTEQSVTGDGEDTIDWKLANKFFFTFGAQNETLIFTAPSKPCSLLLVLKQDGVGSRTMTWPGTVKWVNKTAPTLTTDANAIDMISLYYAGDGNYYAQASLNLGTPA